MNFDNSVFRRIYFTDHIFINISQTLISTWIIGAILIALAIVVRIKIKNFKPVPETKFQNIVELTVEMFDNHVTSIMTKKYSYFGNWFFGLFLFFLVANIIGITGLRPPTADLAVTYAMGFVTVVLMQVIGIKHRKWRHFTDFFKPFPLFMPLNIISDFSRSISLGIRLFGNMMGGLIIMGLVYYLLPWFVTIGPPAVLSMYFDIFVGALHAFIFVTLSMYFMMMKAPMDE
ncbi:MAG: F0F1 ATP synthase subunit A [Defluviitaleaceae bacterium]|nr:F0F1 ATP synthase subunit A [Defluviitaleaceae bacterium]